MGLRFRKSISIVPGVKLNFGTTGMSVSTGVPGFRKTFHTSGRVTTSVGIPGTGLYYVDTKNTRTGNPSRNAAISSQPYSTLVANPVTEINTEDYTPLAPMSHEINSCSGSVSVSQLDAASLKSIHKTSDDSIDWTEVLVSPIAPDDSYNQQMWQYYHIMAPKILSGDKRYVFAVDL